MEEIYKFNASDLGMEPQDEQFAIVQSPMEVEDCEYSLEPQPLDEMATATDAELLQSSDVNPTDQAPIVEMRFFPMETRSSTAAMKTAPKSLMATHDSMVAKKAPASSKKKQTKIVEKKKLQAKKPGQKKTKKPVAVQKVKERPGSKKIKSKTVKRPALKSKSKSTLRGQKKKTIKKRI